MVRAVFMYHAYHMLIIMIRALGSYGWTKLIYTVNINKLHRIFHLIERGILMSVLFLLS